MDSSKPAFERLIKLCSETIKCYNQSVQIKENGMLSTIQNKIIACIKQNGYSCSVGEISESLNTELKPEELLSVIKNSVEKGEVYISGSERELSSKVNIPITKGASQ